MPLSDADIGLVPAGVPPPRRSLSDEEIGLAPSPVQTLNKTGEMGQQQYAAPIGPGDQSLKAYAPTVYDRLSMVAPKVFGPPGEQPPGAPPQGILPNIARVLMGQPAEAGARPEPGLMRFSPATLMPEAGTTVGEIARQALGQVNLENLGIIKGLGALHGAQGVPATLAKAGSAAYFTQEGLKGLTEDSPIPMAEMTPAQKGQFIFNKAMSGLMAIGGPMGIGAESVPAANTGLRPTYRKPSEFVRGKEFLPPESEPYVPNQVLGGEPMQAARIIVDPTGELEVQRNKLQQQAELLKEDINLEKSLPRGQRPTTEANRELGRTLTQKQPTRVGQVDMETGKVSMRPSLLEEPKKEGTVAAAIANTFVDDTTKVDKLPDYTPKTEVKTETKLIAPTTTTVPTTPPTMVAKPPPAREKKVTPENIDKSFGKNVELATAVKEYLPRLATKSKEHQRSMGRYLMSFGDWLQGRTPSRNLVTDYLNEQRQSSSSFVFNKKLTALNVIWEDLRRRGKTELAKAFEGLEFEERAKEPKEDQPSFGVETQVKLANPPRDPSVFQGFGEAGRGKFNEHLYNTYKAYASASIMGARPGETLLLKAGDVDFNKGTLKIPDKKTGKARAELNMPGPVKSALQEHINYLEKSRGRKLAPEELLFESPHNPGKPYSYSTMVNALSRVKKAVGVSEAGDYYAFRHGAADISGEAAAKQGAKAALQNTIDYRSSGKSKAFGTEESRRVVEQEAERQKRYTAPGGQKKSEGGGPPVSTRVSSFGLFDPAYWHDTWRAAKETGKEIGEGTKTVMDAAKAWYERHEMRATEVPAMLNKADTASPIDARRDTATLKNVAVKTIGGDMGDRTREGNALAFVHEAGNSFDHLVRFGKQIEEGIRKHPDKMWMKQAREALDAIEFAKKHWDKLSTIAKEYRRLSDNQFAKEMVAGVKFQGPEIENYVPHLIQEFLSDVLSYSGGSGAAKWFTHERAFPTLARGIAEGQKYQTLDLYKLMEARHRAGNRLVNTHIMAEKLKDMNDPATKQPILVDARKMPEGYEEVTLGTKKFGVMGAYKGMLEGFNGESWFQKTAPRRLAINSSVLSKQIVLMIDLYHPIRLALWAGGIKGLKGVLPGYEKGLFLLDYTEPVLRDMLKRGELTQKEFDYTVENRTLVNKMIESGFSVGRIQDAMHRELIGKIPGIGSVIEGYNKWLFDQFQRGLMTDTWIREFRRQKEARPGVADRDLALEVSKNLNARFGTFLNQSWIRNKTFFDVLRTFMLAPGWNEGLLRSELKAYKDVGQLAVDAARGKRLVVGTMARSMGTIMAATFVMNQFLNYLSRGQPTWENNDDQWGAKISAWIPDKVAEFTHQKPGDGFFLNPAALPMEISHNLAERYHKDKSMIDAALGFLRSRENTFGRAADIGISGKDFGEFYTEDKSRLLAAFNAAIPKPMQAPAAIDLVFKGKQQYPGAAQQRLMTTFGIKPVLAKRTHEEKRLVAEGELVKGKPELENEGLRRRLLAERKMQQDSPVYSEKIKMIGMEREGKAKEQRQAEMLNEMPQENRQWLQNNQLRLPSYGSRITVGGIPTALSEAEMGRYKSLIMETDQRTIEALKKNPRFVALGNYDRQKVFLKTLLEQRQVARQLLLKEIKAGTIPGKKTRRYRFWEAQQDTDMEVTGEE